MVHTGAARAAVDYMTKTLSVEWGREGVRLNTVAPGAIASSGMDNYPAQHHPTFLRTGASCPLGRCGTESEVSSAVVYLLSPAASYVTGATLRVDGGGSLSKQTLHETMMGNGESSGVAEGSRNPPPFHLDSKLEEEFNRRVSKL